MAEELMSVFQQEVEKYQKLQKQATKYMAMRRQFNEQVYENEIVKQELDLVKEGQEVYKLIGPVLVKQQLDEARDNVGKRLDYIKGEMKRTDDAIEDVAQQQENQREHLNKLQQRLQRYKVGQGTSA